MNGAMIIGIDHIVLTVRSVEATSAFYEKALGFRRVDASGLPTALVFGNQKINLHQADRTFEPRARSPAPGSADFCLVTEQDIEAFLAHLESAGVAVELGPVERIGARGRMMSVYFRDPDGNLVEVSRYL